jgi:hypothetical protein
VKRQNRLNPMEWFAWGWIGIFMLLGISTNAIFQGLGLHNGSLFLVYEKPLIYGFYLSIAILIWIGIHIYQKPFQLERRMIYGIIASLLVITYVVSGLQAETPILAQFGILISLMVYLFFVAGIFLIQYERILVLLPKVYLFFGYLIVLYGFLNLLGNAYLLDSLIFYDGVRITSIFQYANAYAVFLLTLWIAILIELIRTSNKWARIGHGLMLIPIFVSFLLTLSRGALIVLPIVAIVTLLMFRFRQQMMIIIYSFVGMGLSLLIYSYLETAGATVYGRIQEARANAVPYDTSSIFSSPAINGWALLIGISVVMAILVHLIAKYVDPYIKAFAERKTTAWLDKIVPVGLLCLFIVGALAITNDWFIQILPHVIRSRVENINFQTHSVYERFTMYRDAIGIWKEHPVLGGGSGVWEALYEKHQSYPYVSAQTHGYLTQLLIEVGLVGLVIYVGMIVMLTIVFIRHYRKTSEEERIKLIFYFMIPITILIHSLIDFEMSYIFYYGFVFLCLGVMTGTQRQPVGSKWSMKTIQKGRWAALAIIIILVFVIAVPANRQMYVINQFKQSELARNEKLSFDKVIDPLMKGLSKDSEHPLLLYQLIVLNYKAYEQTKEAKYLDVASKYMIKLKKAEPHYRQAVELEYVIKSNLGDKQKATDVMLEGIQQYPYEQSFYDQISTDMVSQWEELQKSGSEDRLLLAEKILDNYQEMKRREQSVIDLPDTVNLIRTFAVSNTVRLAAAKVLLDRKNYGEVINILATGIKEDLSNPEDRQVVRYDLAALRLTEQDNEALYQRLIQADAGEAEELSKLIKNSN